MTTEDRWLSVEGIASHLGVSKETIYRWLDRRQIPAHRVGKLWKFQAWEVNDWVRKGGAGESHIASSKKQRTATRETQET